MDLVSLYSKEKKTHTMKKFIFAVTMTLVMGLNLMAQDDNRDIILAPYIQQKHINVETYPAEKLDIAYHFSQNSFYIADNAPQDAAVYSITDVVDYSTGSKLPADFVPDLSTLSYWGYSFRQFQALNWKRVNCFRLSNGKYLVLRTETEATELTYASGEYNR